MSKIIFISGPCGCGKSTFSKLYSEHMAQLEKKPLYIIHGDDFQNGFIEPKLDDSDPEYLINSIHWADILSFNWDCILSTAKRVLDRGIDVIIDYIIEDELPRVKELARATDSELYYIVVTAEKETIEKRLINRGDTGLIDRAFFLKDELDAMPENDGHFIDNTVLSPEDMIKSVILEKYRVI